MAVDCIFSLEQNWDLIKYMPISQMIPVSANSAARNRIIDVAESPFQASLDDFVQLPWLGWNPQYKLIGQNTGDKLKNLYLTNDK